MNVCELWAPKDPFDGTKIHFLCAHNGKLQTFDEWLFKVSPRVCLGLRT